MNNSLPSIIVDNLSDYLSLYSDLRSWKKKKRRIFVCFFPISFPLWAFSILPMGVIFLIICVVAALIEFASDLWKK